MIKITVSAPKGEMLIADRLIEGCIRAVDTTVDDSLKDFNETKKDFSADSQFEFEVERAHVDGGMVVGSVKTGNENYCRLNEGFTIPGVDGKVMAFQPGYIPKTTPNTIPSRPGGPVGPSIVRMRRKQTEVQGRRFDLAVANRNRARFIQRVTEAGGENG